MDITADDRFFTGKDKRIQFTIDTDITGWSLRWVLVKKPVTAQSSDWLVEKTTGAGISITDGPNGVCVVSVDDTDTDDLKGGINARYYHELTRTDAGFEDVLSYGDVVLQQSPTK